MNTSKGKLAFCCFFSFFIFFSAPAAVLYVNVNSSNPVAPYTDWSTAAADIQSAVNAANAGDEVLVTNGVYQTGKATMQGANRVAVMKPILLQSVNGPTVTLITGLNSFRCVYLTNGATLSGFTVTNGLASNDGGGVYCQATNSLVYNCVIIGNTAGTAGAGGYQGAYVNCWITGNNSSFDGGGVALGALTNCLVTGNTALSGGGVYEPVALVNCTVVTNHASLNGGGGVYAANGPNGSRFRNSIVFFNQAPHPVNSTAGQDVWNLNSFCTVSNCCSPDFTNSTCFTNLPGLAVMNLGDYHLQVGSPCIDAGDNASAPSGVDLDGNPRVVNGTVDMGAYENQFTGIAHYVSLISTTPVSPYTNWLTAATNIQDAIDAANAGEIVLVSNGIYQVGGRVVYDAQTNRVAITKPITVTSLNGPIITSIVGNPVNTASAVRCVYLTNNATLTGFTLSNGWTLFSGDTLQDRSGGGVWCESTNALLYNCLLTHDNASYLGSGAYSGTLSNCLIANNNFITCFYGGGAAFSILENCLITNNAAGTMGGGVMGGFLNGCTVAGNFSQLSGGGTASNIVVNSTILNNHATMRDGGGAFRCALTNCTLTGNVATNGDGGGAIYGTLTGCILTTNLAGNGGGACSNLLNNCFLGGDSALTNGGGSTYSVLNGCYLANNLAQNMGGGAYYGNVVGCILSNNFANSTLGDGTCFANVTNSTITHSDYAVAYGICYNCIITNNVTIGIFSNTAYGCLISSNQGAASVFSILNNCLLSFNFNITGVSFHDTLNNCLIIYNTGTGAYRSIMNNCTVVHNGSTTPGSGGGIDNCYATNCIIFFNNFHRDVIFENGFPSYGSISYCCTSVTNFGSQFFGPGNFTNAPLFLDQYHLASNSPCIDSGLTSAVVGSTDFDGRPRIVNGTVDVGASEFQGANVEPFIVWLAQYDLPDDGSADFADSDGTGMNNWQKWIAGLNPTNPASVLQMSTVTNSVVGATVSWQSVTGIMYFVQSSTNLAGAPTFSSIQSNIVGQVGTTSYMDPTATNGGAYFYRVGVQQ